MKLPADLQPHFPHAALIIMSDRVQAKFFLAGGDDVEELDGIAIPHEVRPDSEGKFSDDLHDTPRLKQFTKKMAERAETLVREHAVVHIHAAMPAEVMHHFVGELSADTKAKVSRKVERDLMNEGLVEVIQRLFA